MSSLPKVGSLWRCRDGRQIEITQVHRSPYVKEDFWVDAFVLPPHLPRQRRFTQFSGGTFRGGFLKKIQDAPCKDQPSS